MFSYPLKLNMMMQETPTMKPPPSMELSVSMDPPASDAEVQPETLEEVKEEGPMFHCNLYDAEMVHKIAQEFLTGLASACVDNTTGGIFKSPASVALDIRREMVDYLVQRSETFVAESVVLEGDPIVEKPTDAFDIISDLIDDFAHSKRNFFSRVSGWILSDRREDRIDDFVQEMELNGFWLIGRRESVALTLLRNVDVKNTYHCSMKFRSQEELEQHLPSCSFRVMNCENEGCNAIFVAGHVEQHDSSCPFKILPCEQKCPESIMRRDMDRHCITVCSKKLVNCPFYPVGCLSTVPQCYIGDHRSENLQFHLVCILKLVHKEASAEALKRRAELLMEGPPLGTLAAARDARALTFAIKDLEVKLGPLEQVKPRVDEENSTANEEDLTASSVSRAENASVSPLENQGAAQKHPGTEEKITDMSANRDEPGVTLKSSEEPGASTDETKPGESIPKGQYSLEATIKNEEHTLEKERMTISPLKEEKLEEQSRLN